MGAEMSIEAMKLALDCLEDIFGKDKIDVGAINALRQAIADAEKQEPVAWIYKGEKSFDGNKYIDEYELTASKQVAFWKDKNAEPLYTTPPQPKPLTDEQIDEIYFKSSLEVNSRCEDIYDFVRAIEAAHGIKGEA